MLLYVWSLFPAKLYSLRWNIQNIFNDATPAIQASDTSMPWRRLYCRYREEKIWSKDLVSMIHGHGIKNSHLPISAHCYHLCIFHLDSGHAGIQNNLHKLPNYLECNSRQTLLHPRAMPVRLWQHGDEVELLGAWSILLQHIPVCYGTASQPLILPLWSYQLYLSHLIKQTIYPFPSHHCLALWTIL